MSDSSSTTSSSTDSDSENERRRRRKKRKRKKKKKQRKKERKRRKKKEKKQSRKRYREDDEKMEIQKKKRKEQNANPSSINHDTQSLPSSPPKQKKKVMVPMTKQEYDKVQSVIRRVYDDDTGRIRLVKGTGKIIEEIVTQSRHYDINKASTRGDGESYMRNLIARRR
jgi:hypothetical protein